MMNSIDVEKNKFSKIGATVASIFLCFVFGGAVAHSVASPVATADEKSDMARLDEIQTLSDRDNTEGLRQLQEFKRTLPAGTSDAVRLETLKVLVTLYADAGKIKLADATINELLQFAEAHHNKDAIALAHISKSLEILDEGKPELALAKLREVQAAVKSSSDPEVNMRLNAAFGATYKVSGKFEQALRHYLEALRLSDLQPRRKVQARLYKLDAIAALYWNMKDPEKALATSQEAIALSPLANAPKTLSSLISTQGIALSNLGREDEALDAYKKVLKIGIDANMPGTEATALSNISDHYLIARDYRNAEKFARQALAKSVAIDDKTGIATAKINIGFALVGMGKIKDGVDYVKEGTKFYQDSDSKVNVESITGELATMYEKAGLYKEALATLRQQQKLNDELFRSDRSRAVASLQEQFNADQRQKQIELLAKENDLKDADIKNRRLQQIVTLLAAVVTVMAGVFIFLLYRRVRKVNEQLQQANTQLAFHAVRDPLTGLYNRRSFVELMKARQAQTEAERREGSADNPDCLILMDIDLFKHINDTWGHAVGDSVLSEVAHRLKKAVRDSDMVLRWGGEEFLIYSPKSNPVQITGLVDRVLRTIGEQPVEVGDLRVPVTMTAGFISLPFSGVSETLCDWEKTLQIADMALYLGKAHGRNRAYGLARLLVPSEQAMPILERDLSAAMSGGMVEMIEVIGPEQNKDHLTG
ncbi:MAG: GGDEF domain-containing protein [Undibacterium sp.]|uniref:GGDEF domain-containing protein n=1 Tax=Undibacterium sp. TaxID=1914977 RepID=UPI00271DD091|nr:GGDEF domain-containing protein [Undibacterium sp.]MDO8651476.1 GGDEF domain-containing protein [Undibacterium sp.]